MSIEINRREFLTALAAVGAVIVLPVDPSEAEIEVAWKRLVADPWFFEVEEHGTIVAPGVEPPNVNADAYKSISVVRIRDVESLVAQVDEIDELRSHFQYLYTTHIEKQQESLETQIDALATQMDEEPDDSIEIKSLQSRIDETNELLDALDPYADDDAWKAWVREAGTSGLSGFKLEVEKWLQSPVDERSWESWPESSSGQGQALSFFRGQEVSILYALSVVIVEGDHPGSTYYAAELKGSIDAANSAAARLELPFRFRRVTN
jgi:hypothetical protein